MPPLVEESCYAEALKGIRHLEIRDLWVQDAVRKQGIPAVKMPREQNVADD